MKTFKTKPTLFITIVVVFTLLLSWFVAKNTEQEMRKALLQQTTISANSIDIRNIKNLTGTLADLKSPDYLRLKQQFANIMKTDKSLHFAYLMGVRKNGNVFFYVDDKPDGHPEGSPPGSPYNEAPKEFNRVMETGIPTVEGPSTDSWGSYASGCAPVIDSETGKTIAIFAIDFDTRSWYWQVAAHAALPVGLILVLMLGAIATLVSRKRGKLLKENEEKYRVMFSDSPDSYLILKDNIIIECNHATEISLNCTREKLIGTSPYTFFPENQEDGTLSTEAAIEKREEALLFGKNTFEWIMRRKDGTNFWAIVSISKMTLNDEAVLFATWTDISEKKKVEEELLKAVIAANAASQAKSEFLANMSHEIRTPLNGVIGFTDLLKNTPLSLVQEQYVKNANASGHTLLGIINDILDFSKIEAGMMDLEITKTDMIELLGHSVDLIKYSASKKNVEVLLDIDPELPRFAEVDSVRLKQILANLLGNAVKFTEKGEVELKVEYKKMTNKSGRISFFVRDTGIGINEEQQGKLFKAFSQGDSSTTRKFGGTGLGLIISEMIANKMGGKIEIESKIDLGTTFHFNIITKTEQGEKNSLLPIDTIKRCLVIDDNENNRLILEHMMSNWGIECISSDNGHQAVKTIKTSEPFDVIICDYHMPELNGLDTIKLIREKLNTNKTKQPIILLYSSSDNAELHKKCDELGVRFRLTKPVKSDELYNFLCSINSPASEIQYIEKSIESIVAEKFVFNEAVTILIAEDNEFNMLLAKAIVTKLIPSAKVIEAANGKEAVMLWIIEQPDLILMDIQMPEMGGVEAALKIREQEKGNKYTPIIALTAGALKEEREKCMEAGMDDFLTKPIEQEKLEQVMINLLLKK